MKLLLILLYNITLIAATGYLVFWKGYSGWWFLLTLVLIASTKCDEQ
jgi:hypothetical protein